MVFREAVAAPWFFIFIQRNAAREYEDMEVHHKSCTGSEKRLDIARG